MRLVGAERNAAAMTMKCNRGRGGAERNERDTGRQKPEEDTSCESNGK